MPMLRLPASGADAAAVWRCGDRDKPFGVELAHFSPEHGEGFVVRRVDVNDLARWLHGVKGAFIGSAIGDPVQRASMCAEAERTLEMLADFDWTRWQLRNLLSGPGSASRRKDVVGRRRLLIGELRSAMERGLEGRVGQEASRTAVYEALTARRIDVVGLRVCECCHVVFETPRRNRPANRCPACRRSPPRYKLYPVVDGGWHLWARLGPPWHHYMEGEPGRPRGVVYGGRCTACGGEFTATSAIQRLCRNCGGSSGRVRRARGGSPRGRQRYRFAARNGPLSSVSVGFPNGEQGALTAKDGVVEVSDAEVALQLRQNRSLLELTGATGAERLRVDE
jgi:Zn finger protein HypA/HybF involved in hydrogenase expression